MLPLRERRAQVSAESQPIFYELWREKCLKSFVGVHVYMLFSFSYVLVKGSVVEGPANFVNCVVIKCVHLCIAALGDPE